jgi:hypothetical protein
MVAMRQTAPGYSLPRDSSALHASDSARKVGLAATSSRLIGHISPGFDS